MTPAPLLEPVRSGEVASSLWRPAGSELEYVGSFVGSMKITDQYGRENPIEVGATHVQSLTHAEIEALRSSLGRSPSSLSIIESTPLSGTASGREPDPEPRVRLSLPSKAKSFRDAKGLTASGQAVSVSLIRSPRNAERRPIGLVAHVEGRLAMIVTFTYDSPTGGPIGMRVTSFAEDGTAARVQVFDFSDMVPVGNTRIGAVIDNFERACGRLGALLGPTPLSAQFLECEAQNLNLAAATATFYSADMVLAALLGACGFTAGTTCLGAGAAFAAVAAASLWMASAAQAVTDCYNGILTEATSPAGQGGDPTADGSNCYTAILEISYDGGVTWQYLGTATICG